MYVNMTVNNIEIAMEVDSGTLVSVISESKYLSLFAKVKLYKTELVLKGYGNVPLYPIGVIKANVISGDIERQLELYVMPGSGPTLIGRQ